MKRNSLVICVILFLLCSTGIKAQVKKFDTTVKMNDQGYHIECSNKNADQNTVTVSPVNLKITSTKPSFKVMGRVTKAMTDDFNSDGRPDLAICIYSGANNETGTIAGISYTADKSFVPVYFPDIYLDPKIREGYKGYDEFSVLTGTLLRKFPVYLANDLPDKPTGGKRTIQYGVVDNGGSLSFKVLRAFDTK